ncbi:MULTISPECIES: hypothetical protein [unclassified Amycolatopsis]|uniref:hypothetical protein n=1 Tax=unclassified Amycolatopsis TaxID=2618356 RepID=UPI0018F67161|nr:MULTISPECIES: hypothetical protein [unclassified Amycolatopsis]
MSGGGEQGGVVGVGRVQRPSAAAVVEAVPSRVALGRRDRLRLRRRRRDRLAEPDRAVKKLTIKTGKNAGQHPSVASLYRALADTDA